VPEISRFHGIIIRMYMEAGSPHSVPHFHAYYADTVAVYALDPIQIIAGGLPTRQRRLVEAWAEIHWQELDANWRSLQAGRTVTPIEPLR
jgi:hypothetical protein